MTITRMIFSGVILCAVVLSFPQRGHGQNAGTAEQTGPYASLEIRDVTVIDGSGAPAFGPVNILIRGNRIERVVPSDSISRKEKDEEGGGKKEAKPPDRVIEGKGMYVMPGLCTFTSTRRKTCRRNTFTSFCWGMA
jgi:hypothetical protein